MIEITGLSKRFGRLQVLDDIEATIPGAQVTLLVGPNASGKSTLLKSILGLTLPDAGRIVVDGLLVSRHPQSRERIGYMPQEPRFPEHLTGTEILELLHQLRGRGTATDEELIDALLMREELPKSVRVMSGGTRQKLNAIAAFLFRPRVLVLDEPTAGLDPLASGVLKRKILGRRTDGAAILVTSHVMSELEDVADQVLYLANGRLRFAGAVDELRAATGEGRLDRAIANMMAGAGS